MAKSVQSKIKSSAKKTAKKVAKKHPVLTFFVLIIFALCVIGGYYVYNKLNTNIMKNPITLTDRNSAFTSVFHYVHLF